MQDLLAKEADLLSLRMRINELSVITAQQQTTLHEDDLKIKEL